MLAALTRARETAPIPARSDADRPAPAGSAALRLLADVDSSFSRNWCWQLRRWTLALGRPAPVERSELPGHRQRSQIPQHRQWWRSPSLAQRCGAAARKDQRNLAALIMLAALTRARETAPIPARSDADRPAPAGSAALRLLADVDSSFSRNWCWQLRRWTLALGRPAPVERSELPGHRQRSQIPQHRQWWRSPSLAQRCGAAARKDQRNLAALIMLAALTRALFARRRRFQRALTPTDLHRPARRRCGCWPTSTVLFRGIGVGSFGAGRWRSGDRRRSSAASYRVIGNDRKFRSTDSGGALPRSLSAAEQRLGKISGIWPR